MATYFGFAFADSMLDQTESFLLKREPASALEIRQAKDVISVLNPSHKPTVVAMQQRYCFENIAIPEKAPSISLVRGDVLYAMTTRGLPRLEGTRQYTTEEIDKATFTFAKYTVL